jgi:hypothetical protein
MPGMDACNVWVSAVKAHLCKPELPQQFSRPPLQSGLDEGVKGTVLSAFYWGYAVSQVWSPAVALKVLHFAVTSDGAVACCLRCSSSVRLDPGSPHRVHLLLDPPPAGMVCRSREAGRRSGMAASECWLPPLLHGL